LSFKSLSFTSTCNNQQNTGCLYIFSGCQTWYRDDHAVEPRDKDRQVWILSFCRFETDYLFDKI